MTITKKLFKQSGTPVFVRFGLYLQVILKIKDWQQELQDIWAVNLKVENFCLYELPIEHGISCHCCTKIITESYTHPTIAETKRERKPGRPRLGRGF
jgi:hypothetical protein